MSDRPVRKCNGGFSDTWCGNDATVVCTAKDGLQWYACSDPKHHKDDKGNEAEVMPIEKWWKEFDEKVTSQ